MYWPSTYDMAPQLPRANTKANGTVGVPVGACRGQRSLRETPLQVASLFQHTHPQALSGSEELETSFLIGT